MLSLLFTGGSISTSNIRKLNSAFMSGQKTLIIKDRLMRLRMLLVLTLALLVKTRLYIG